MFNNETDTRKRPDLILYAPKIKTIMHENGWLGDVVVDASLTYPLSNSALQLFNTAINRGDYLPAVEKREREKISKYSAVATSNNLAFVPAVADLFGSWSVHLSSLVRELVDKAAYRSTISKSILLEYWMQRISICIQSFATDLVINRVKRLYENRYFPYDESPYVVNMLVHPTF